MASFNVFTLDCPASTGNQTHAHGLGETPKAVIFWATNRTTDGSAADWQLSYGWADVANATQYAIGMFSDDNVGTTVTYGVTDDSYCIYLTGDAAVVLQAAWVSADATNITLNWGTVISGSDVHCLAIGGSEVSAYAGTFQGSSGTPPFDQGITDPGFTPSVVLFAHARTSGADSAGPTWPQLDMGVMDSSGNQLSYCSTEADNQGTSNVQRGFWSNKCITTGDSGSVREQAAYKSMDANGFTVTWTSYGLQRYFAYLALSGINCVVTNDTQKTSTSGTKAVTVSGITPEAALFFSHCSTNDGTFLLTENNRTSIGGGVSSSARAAVWSGSSDNLATTNASLSSQADQCILMMTENSGSPTFDAAADISSFSANTITLDWDDGAGGNPDATARVFGVVAFASVAAAGLEGPLVGGSLIRGGVLSRRLVR